MSPFHRAFSEAVRRTGPGSATASNLSPVACVGCGWCCLHDQCDDSHRRHGYVSRCPEVYWSAEQARYRCRLAEHPQLGTALRVSQAMGLGCCASGNAWRSDVRNRDEEGE